MLSLILKVVFQQSHRLTTHARVFFEFFHTNVYSLIGHILKSFLYLY